MERSTTEGEVMPTKIVFIEQSKGPRDEAVMVYSRGVSCRKKDRSANLPALPLTVSQNNEGDVTLVKVSK